MLKKAISHEKNFTKSYLNLSNCYLAQEKYHDALKVLKEGKKVDKENIRFDQNIIGIYLQIYNKDKESSSQWGLVRTLINNMVIGVESGFSKTLEVNGVGYRAAAEGDILQLQLGYSHDIKVAIPKEISVKCSKPTEIVISGANKQKVGQFAAEIRSLR